jgi:outer membrane protein assembly factor BamE (lipoprotein component of BamABCDE complex)
MTRARAFAPALLLGALLASATARPEEPVDSCSSLLGSLGVELRFAHRLRESERTTFVCPRETRALVGASRQRVLNALGSPDASDRPQDAAGALAWYYYFGPAPRANEERDPRQPELRFDFDPSMAVAAVHCRQHH